MTANTAPAATTVRHDERSAAVGGSEADWVPSLAELGAALPGRRGPRLIERLRRPQESIEAVYRRLAEAPRESLENSRAAEWLLDNHYIVRRALRLLREEFPADFDRRLPRFTEGERAGLPRIYCIARELAAAGQAPLDLAAALQPLRAFQAVQPLRIAEAWALPVMLRLVALERLGMTVQSVVPPVGTVALADDQSAVAIISRCIRDLRTLETTDWKQFVESISVVDQTLRADPAAAYAGMDFDTRDSYRKVVEELSARGARSEPEVAGEALRLAREGHQGRYRHVGHYLVANGRAQLEAAIGHRPSLGRRFRRACARRPAALYVGAIALLTLAALAALAALLQSHGADRVVVGAALLLTCAPASGVALHLINAVVTRIVPPSVLPKMDFEAGIPADWKTLVAVPSMLTSVDEVETLVRELEIRFLANEDDQLHFALLTDFGDAEEQATPEDAALLDAATNRIRILNSRYGGESLTRFLLLHRRRRWTAGEGRWMGWERKRGKLAELNRLLLGEPDADGLQVVEGDPGVLASVRFVITLDADTELPRGAANRLVGTLAHPLNQAEFDAERGRVVAGYTVLQPRIEISPLGTVSWFARLFSSASGLDPYTRAVSDVYQDLFAEGVFAGKGIYDVAAFERSLAGRVPDGCLLSHDLFEGIHGRAGLATDIVLLEDYPAHYLAYARRMHRWARGDWQLLPWLGHRVPLAPGGRARSRLTFISRWKVLDNLRRTLMAPSLLAWFIAAWLWFPGPTALWTALALLVPAAPGLVDVVAQLIASVSRDRRVSFDVGDALRSAASFWAIELTFLPHQAIVLCDAILRTLWRVYMSRRHLLEWTPAAHTARRLSGRARAPVWREMAAAPIVASSVAAAIAVLRPDAFPFAAPLLFFWLVSPEVALWISRVDPGSAPELTPAQLTKLRLLARRTWSFFETYGGPEDQWLPPDHFQEDPRGIVARRTSPTNIGFLLLASLSAYDFGYRGLLWVALRVKNVFDTLERMERYRGHFLNWYDTATLAPLQPAYVSTVDSGNLAAALLTVKQSCEELLDEPVIRTSAWDGLADTAGVLGSVVARSGRPLSPAAAALVHHLDALAVLVDEFKHDPGAWHSGAIRLSDTWLAELDRQLVALLEREASSFEPALLAELRQWSGQLHRHLERLRREIELFLPWLGALGAPPRFFADSLSEEGAVLWEEVRSTPANASLRDLGSVCDELEAKLARFSKLIGEARHDDSRHADARAWIAQLNYGVRGARQMSEYLTERLDEIHTRADRLVQETDFALLYDRRRRLFYIGCNVSAGRFDDNHYDLLASEARLTSFIAIAKGDVPEEHWLHLGRPIGTAVGERTLLSWSGTTFEYLMPSLLLREGTDTLVGHSCGVAVKEQIAFAAQRGIPWGISESGYARLDAQQNYQYRAFGVPSLGFRRELEEELVVAPYASMLALRFAPQRVFENLEKLEELGMVGTHGFYEAIDFTWSRLPAGSRHAVVRSFMAHHQGMTLASLDNFLNRDPLVRRFHAAPIARTAEVILFERPASRAPIEQTQPTAAGARPRPRRRRLAMGPWKVRADGPLPQAHALSNGRYTAVVTDGGGGFSRWQGLALTRWTPDPTLDEQGFRLYLGERNLSRDWALAQGAARAAGREVNFHPHQVEFHARADEIAVRESIVVAPGADVEIRFVTLTNEGDRRRRLTLTGYGEVVLGDALADRRHPAFSKLFVESEYVEELNALIFRRRRRAATEERPFLVHMLVLPPGGARRIGYETSRERFLGRGQSGHTPAALASHPPRLTRTTGASLDPVMVLSAEIDLPPRRSRDLAFVTLVAGTRQEALALAAANRSLAELEWTFELARSHCETELGRLGLESPSVATAARLLSPLLYPHASLRAAPDVLERNTLGRSSVWRFAVSGDLPILLVRIQALENTLFLQDVLRAHVFWRGRGIAIDLVVLNERASGYSAELADRLGRVIAIAGVESWLQRPGGVFVVNADQMTEAERILLQSAARVVLDAGGAALADQVAEPPDVAPLPPLVAVPGENRMGTLARPTDLLFDNGLGGFHPNGDEYVIHLEPGQTTPAPWVNVIANPRFGCVVSEAGGGYSWSDNSGENRLTPWRNDPVADTPSEALYLRDEETGAIWSPTPLPVPAAAPYQIRHGAGYTAFTHSSHDLEQELRVFVAANDPVKLVRLHVANRADRPRRLTATYYAEWVQGPLRDGGQALIVPAFDVETEALLVRNPWNEDFAGAVAFLAASQKLHGFTADRTEFLGRRGRYARPTALVRVGLANTVRAGLDPCAALQVHIDLGPGESKTVNFVLGQGRDRDEALALIRAYRDPGRPEAAFAEVEEHWDDLLGAASVHTPEPSFDVMLNRWLLYQTTSSRIWGRTGYYQSSGAYGFRDQLQDVTALLHVAPAICRAHLLESARHQFEEGDVLHWWHPPGDAGVRTRCSDDLLWLPFVAAHYVARTGDVAVLDEVVAFLHAEPLRVAESERYERFRTGGQSASLFEHCLRALRRSETTGPHGLPHFGGGDWNDGMNRVGARGRGESVWLGWFRYAALSRFAELCERIDRRGEAEELRRDAAVLKTAIEAHAWDGDWYLRGYYDDGRRLGSSRSDECRIDSIAQSWAVLSGAGDPKRRRAAMDAVRARLMRDGLILLFAPPFERSSQDPGYVRGYPAGVRENGGQYTHAAVWALWAFLELGEVEAAVRDFLELLPIASTPTAGAVERYRTEPYVLAADVYGATPWTGRGGWTWYTGSAGWAYRFGWEGILGVRLEPDGWRIDPRVPPQWAHFELTLRCGRARYEIRVANPDLVGRGVRRIVLDGAELSKPVVPRVDDGGVHRVEITLG